MSRFRAPRPPPASSAVRTRCPIGRPTTWARETGAGSRASSTFRPRRRRRRRIDRIPADRDRRRRSATRRPTRPDSGRSWRSDAVACRRSRSITQMSARTRGALANATRRPSGDSRGGPDFRARRRQRRGLAGRIHRDKRRDGRPLVQVRDRSGETDAGDRNPQCGPPANTAASRAPASGGPGDPARAGIEADREHRIAAREQKVSGATKNAPLPSRFSSVCAAAVDRRDRELDAIRRQPPVKRRAARRAGRAEVDGAFPFL